MVEYWDSELEMLTVAALYEWSFFLILDLPSLYVGFILQYSTTDTGFLLFEMLTVFHTLHCKIVVRYAISRSKMIKIVYFQNVTENQRK